VLATHVPGLFEQRLVTVQKHVECDKCRGRIARVIAHQLLVEHVHASLQLLESRGLAVLVERDDLAIKNEVPIELCR
jgi:hypothetical protein